MSRFWSALWKVAGFLLLMGWLQQLVGEVVVMFGLLEFTARPVAEWLWRLSAAVVPIWGTLTFIDWRWGWKADTAGLRSTPAALFWLFPGLLGGLLAGLLAHVAGGLATGRFTWPEPELSPAALPVVLIGLVGAFATELVYRGALVSRLQADLSGRDLLILSMGTPMAWALVQSVGIGFIGPHPSTGITGLGTAVLSAFLTLLFLRTDSVWLAAGVRAGLLLAATLFSAAVSDQGLLLVFALPTAILLLQELARWGNLRRPGGGQRRGPQRMGYGKTVRGPWGPH